MFEFTLTFCMNQESLEEFCLYIWDLDRSFYHGPRSFFGSEDPVSLDETSIGCDGIFVKNIVSLGDQRPDSA